MKFMKLGTRPDTFFTDEAIRTVISDVPSDLTVLINSTTYLLHKYPILPKCGLLQRLYSESSSSDNSINIELHDIPGGNEAFELCAKFCYGITISLSAHNFLSAFCAAKFLRMTETLQNGNFVVKLEAFFSSCILEGWKDTIVTLCNTEGVYEWSENLGIVRRCIDSIVDKILTTPAKVTWPYTYTRPGFEKKRHQSAPKDWWTEEISFLDIDIFRCVIAAIKTAKVLQPQLIGEALHVYASRWLTEISRPNNIECSSSTSQARDSPDRKQRILEKIVSLIPADHKGSVSIRFLFRLISIANSLSVSQATKSELLRMAGLQLDDAMPNDLLIIPAQSTSDDEKTSSYYVDLVRAVLESYLKHWKRRTTMADESSQSLGSICKVGKLLDSYLQVVAKDANMPVRKIVSLAETLPGIARTDHDDLYWAIDIYLKEHLDVSKADKKQLCCVLDCKKLSKEVRAHAVRNERLPLRTVVQVLFFEQEKNGNCTTYRRKRNHKFSSDQLGGRQGSSSVVKITDKMNKSKLNADEPSHKERGNTARENLKKSSDKLMRMRPELSFKLREFPTTPEMEKRNEIEEEGSLSQLNSHQKVQVRRILEDTCS